MTRLRLVLALVALGLLGACIDGRDLDRPAVPLGDFSLGHNVVIAPNLTKGPLSRDATAEEWSTAVQGAIAERFGRYEGSRIYHFGVSVEGYVLAQAGIPLVLQPKSVVILRLTVWDDAAGAKMNAEPREITVVEAISAESLAGSGLTQTREEQLDNLAVLAAKQIEEFLVAQMEEAGWFRGFRPDGAGTAPQAGGTAPPDGPAPLVDAPPAAPGEGAGLSADTVGRMLVVEPVEAVTDPPVVLVPPGPGPTDSRVPETR